ncbi:MAG TPA: beta-L-arabinofuranosidase domain-containing protein [Roseiflexaceae bacterium]|nr:beta-L-arabinofuranosidase domain-containing protein [Roseiflexaceae bacterium]
MSIAFAPSSNTTNNPVRHLTLVPHTRVTLDDPVWAQRQQINRERTLEHIYGQCEQTGRIAALDGVYDPEVVARGVLGGNVPVLFWDSDVAKWIEAAAYSLATHPDPHLDALLDQVIARIAAAQQPDGYINCWFTAVEPAKRWSNLRDWHELYDAGHLVEAAVAHFQATGKRTLLDVMVRYVDYIASVFGREPGKRRGYCGHPEIELALIRLAQATGEARHRDLARYFVDERGQQPHYFDQEALARGEDPAAYWFGGHEYSQSHRPVREQTEVVGHAVRATYLYSAMADLAASDGDTALLDACKRLWTHLTTRRMYVMGGIGSSKHNEGFTGDYDLPNESAYAETCAAIALVFWAQRMLLVDLDRRYADVMELALYNAVLSGISLDGTRFFYDNPLASAGGHHRQEWFHCPCCPPNLARLVASAGGYLYAQGEDEVVVHLYAQSRAELELDGQAVTLRQETKYPWDGSVRLTVGTAAPTTFGLRLRLPGWCRNPRVSVNGEPVDLEAATGSGYALVRRTWRDGDVVALELPMPTERVYAHPAVAADVGSVALRRGPLVYCLEQADQSAPLGRILLPASAALEARFDPQLLGGVVVLEAQAAALAEAGWEDTLYRSAPPAAEPCPIRAIPYFLWDNRAPGPMAVWLRELFAAAEA